MKPRNKPRSIPECNWRRPNWKGSSILRVVKEPLTSRPFLFHRRLDVLVFIRRVGQRSRQLFVHLQSTAQERKLYRQLIERQSYQLDVLALFAED